MMKPTDLLVAQIVEFSIGVEIGSIRQILAYNQSFKVPKSPALLSGIMHAKGGVVPIVNLAEALGIQAAEPHPFRVAVVLEWDGTRCSFVCDAVHEIVPVKGFEPASKSQIGENMFIEKTLERSGVETHVINLPALLSLVHGDCSIDQREEKEA